MIRVGKDISMEAPQLNPDGFTQKEGEKNKRNTHMYALCHLSCPVLPWDSASKRSLLDNRLLTLNENMEPSLMKLPTISITTFYLVVGITRVRSSLMQVNFESQFSSSTIWSPGIKLRPPGVVGTPSSSAESPCQFRISFQ